MEKLFSFQNTGQFLPFLCSNNSNSSSIFEQKDYALLLAFFSSSGRVMSAVREKANISINVRSTGQRFRTECPGDTRAVGSIPGLGRSSGRKWQPTPVFKPKKFHEHGRLESYGPWGLKSDTTEQACMPVEHKIPIFKLCTDYYFLTLSHTHRSWLPQYTFKMVIFTVIQSTIFFQAPYSTEIFPESSYYQNKVSNPRSKKNHLWTWYRKQEANSTSVIVWFECLQEDPVLRLQMPVTNAWKLLDLPAQSMYS